MTPCGWIWSWKKKVKSFADKEKLTARVQREFVVVIDKNAKENTDFYNKYSVAFNIISFLVAIGSICLTIWISKQPVTLPQKELSCITTNSKSLVLMLGNDSNLKLLYGEREVSKPCITSIVISKVLELTQ